MHQSTIAVQAVISTQARAEVTSIGIDAVTVYPAGVAYQPSLHWADLDGLEAWHADLGEKIAAERARRQHIRGCIAEARDALRLVGGVVR